MGALKSCLIRPGLVPDFTSTSQTCCVGRDAVTMATPLGTATAPKLTSTATSLMSRKFDRFEEKRRQQLDKKTKAVKSIFRKSQSKDPSKGEHVKPTRQHSIESQSVGQEFNEFLKTLSKDTQIRVSKQINSFVDKMLRCVEFQSVDESGEQVHDFYNTMNEMVTLPGAYHELTQEEVDRVNELTERYVTTRLYKALITLVNAVNEEKDLAIQNRIRSLAWVSSQHLECGVKETSEEVRESLDLVITDKLKCLVSSSHHVLNLLKQSNGGSPASADDFLPALIYCILQANPPLLHSNIAYITNFAQQSSLQSGEAGYFFTNLCCAVAFIEKMTADSLGLTADEFERYMSGVALPPNALEGDAWLCEGMRVMQQNLKTLDDLQVRMDRLITESDSLVQEMDMMAGGKLLTVEASGTATGGSGYPSHPSTAPLSPDILAAQQSLSFLQGLTDLGAGLTLALDTGGSQGVENVKYQENKSLLDDSPPSNMSSLPDLLDSFGPLEGSGPVSLPSVVDPFVRSAGSTPPPLPPKHSSVPPPLVARIGAGPAVLDPSQPPPRSSYSGFTIQGGRIPNIPCDTGHLPHSFSTPPDPLSPPLEGPQPPLPPPLIPTASGAEGGSSGASSEVSTPRQQLQKEDTIDKVYSVLGDIVQTFDSLL
ncbi:Rab5 GDP/GTP exchange factor-like [Homarus americanus]|uniref:Rab5 GDP/GTP exchange factor-like n=1 Tax=Homarus americanus TaxID=6706 RepID=A0A8J5MV83_HOMAM|nr:Rab5 GDP/GTP exchange factor-like [Homarus americanus]